MNTTNFESDNNLKSAENYYNAMLAKDFDKMTSYLHDNVHFILNSQEYRHYIKVNYGYN